MSELKDKKYYEDIVKNVPVSGIVEKFLQLQKENEELLKALTEDPDINEEFEYVILFFELDKWEKLTQKVGK